MLKFYQDHIAVHWFIQVFPEHQHVQNKGQYLVSHSMLFLQTHGLSFLQTWPYIYVSHLVDMSYFPSLYLRFIVNPAKLVPHEKVLLRAFVLLKLRVEKFTCLKNLFLKEIIHNIVTLRLGRVCQTFASCWSPMYSS